MRLRYFITLLVFLFVSCNLKNSDKKQGTNPAETDTISSENGESIGQTSGSSDKVGTNGFWEKLVMHEIRNSDGVVAATIPFPSSWKLMAANSNGGPSITGPNGINITDFPLQSFMYNYNRNLQEAYSRGGQQMREMPGVEQLIQQDIIPWAQNKGMQYVKYYEIPEISKMDFWYSEQLFKAMPSRPDVAAFGTEWKTSEGNPYFLLLHINVSTSQAMQNWYYTASGLEADPAHFEAAKKQYIFSLANMRYNLQPIMTYNQQEAQRVGQSWAQHNQRMAQNQANFEASQRAFVNKSSAINDAIMSGWRDRNAASDKQQEQTIDNIYERSNVQDPGTGQKYKVAAGSNQYWMNSNGEYIGTQQSTYDPNLDNNMNEQRWRELKEIKP